MITKLALSGLELEGYSQKPIMGEDYYWSDNIIKPPKNLKVNEKFLRILVDQKDYGAPLKKYQKYVTQVDPYTGEPKINPVEKGKLIGKLRSDYEGFLNKGRLSDTDKPLAEQLKRRLEWIENNPNINYVAMNDVG